MRTLGCILIRPPGFEQAWLTARRELDRRAAGRQGIPLMRFWELVSAFRDFDFTLRHTLAGAAWREPYLSWHAGFDALVARQDRAVLDHRVPLDLSREVAARCDLRFLYDPERRVVRRGGGGQTAGERVVEKSALEVHDAWGGAVIEEVLESGSARVD